MGKIFQRGRQGDVKSYCPRTQILGVSRQVSYILTMELITHMNLRLVYGMPLYRPKCVTVVSKINTINTLNVIPKVSFNLSCAKLNLFC